VGVAIVLSVGSLMTPAPVRPPTGVSQSPLTGALVVIGATIVALALGDLLGETNGASVTVAVAGAVAGGARLLQLISSLAELAESKIEARTDHLTGIANRRALSLAMVAARNRGVGAALVVVDLDRFQDVNDQYGHAVGDEVLRSVAVRLKELVPVGGVLGRLGGDEFAAILPAGQLADGRRFATEVLTAVARPVATSAGPIYLDATVGVAATSPADIQPRKVAATPGLGLHRPGPRDLDPGELLRQADAALAEAKTSGRGISVYDSAADARASLERRRLSELRELLSREHDGRAGGVVMHYQPQIDLRTGTVAGAEALVRWQHPEHGLLGPGEFVDLVERHGLMQEMTEQVLHRAASDAGRWVRAGHDVPVSINVSTSSLRPELLSRIDAALSAGDLHPRHLQLEVTETTLMADPQRSLQVLRELSRRGTSVSIDDYGTGYSSLAYLNELEAVELKLDRSFVARLVHDPRTAAIVAGTVDLAHGLGLHVVAEGVEDVATVHVLMAMGCDRSQGFLHARPMPVGRFLVWLGQDHRPVRLETEPQQQMLSR
ncbi:bifunctional diguanylate cyclase/phosphodiesterase, partial [Nocardioides sp.]|uniref:putative bifunctional diguanylate cyclase/phosphodiesterase n=1 Tax=Nocardioides sp. TaxID=35761 RepID=UPI001A295079